MKKRRKWLDLVQLGSVLTAAGLGSSKRHIANCQKEWNLLFKLSDSMPRRIEAVLAVNGWMTKY